MEAFIMPSVITEQTTVPLCVDLDGTLIKTDLVWESLVRLIRQRPWDALLVPIWLLGGRARLKEHIAQRVQVEPGALPCHEEVVDFLRTEHQGGRPIFLATASDQKLAQAVADHFGIFKE